MRTWLFVGLALLALSALIMAISLTLDFIASDTAKTHEQLLSTVHALNVMEYAALGFQLIGAWVTWRGFARSKQRRLLKYAATVFACDIGSFLIGMVVLDSHWMWAWTVFRSLAW